MTRDRRHLPDRLDDAGSDTARGTVFLTAYEGKPPVTAFDLMIAAGYGTVDAGPGGWTVTMFGATGTAATFDAACDEWAVVARDRSLTEARRIYVDAPTDHDEAALIAACRTIHALSPERREQNEAWEFIRWMGHSPEDAA